MEIGIELLRKHLPDAIHLQELLLFRSPDKTELLVKMPAEQTRVGESDTVDPESVDQMIEERISGFLHRLHQSLIGPLAKALHRENFLPVPFKMVEVPVAFNKAVPDEFLERHLGESLDIQSIPAHKEGKLLDPLRRTVRIFAVQKLRILILSDLRLLPAGRAESGRGERPGFCEILRKLRDNHIRLIDRDAVPQPE